jgi:hypothetical protein
VIGSMARMHLLPTRIDRATADVDPLIAIAGAGGVTPVPIMAMIMLLASRRHVIGSFILSVPLNSLDGRPFLQWPPQQWACS